MQPDTRVRRRVVVPSPQRVPWLTCLPTRGAILRASPGGPASRLRCTEQVDLASHCPGPVTGTLGGRGGTLEVCGYVRQLPVMIKAVFGELMPVARS